MSNRRQPLTDRERLDLLKAVAAGRVTRSPAGEDWRTTGAPKPLPGFRPAGNAVGRIRVSTKHMDRLADEGLVNLDGSTWTLTDAGRAAAEAAPVTGPATQVGAPCTT
jgi:hypothetical protein